MERTFGDASVKKRYSHIDLVQHAVTVVSPTL